MKGDSRPAHLVIAAAAIVCFWGLASFLLGPRVLPGPVPVARRFVQMFPVSLWKHMAASLARVLGALTVAGFAAVPLGVFMGRAVWADRLLAPVAYLLYPVPKIALLPLILLAVGLGNTARILVVALVLFFQILLAARDGARSVASSYFLSLRSLGGKRWHAVRYVIAPAVLPRLLTALRIGSGTALAVLFFAETFFTRFGLGHFIVDSWMKVAYVDMFAGIVGIALLGLALFLVIDALERRLCRWRRE